MQGKVGLVEAKTDAWVGHRTPSKIMVVCEGAHCGRDIDKGYAKSIAEATDRLIGYPCFQGVDL